MTSLHPEFYQFAVDRTRGLLRGQATATHLFFIPFFSLCLLSAGRWHLRCNWGCWLAIYLEGVVLETQVQLSGSTTLLFFRCSFLTFCTQSQTRGASVDDLVYSFQLNLLRTSSVEKRCISTSPNLMHQVISCYWPFFSFTHSKFTHVRKMSVVRTVLN